MKEKAARSGTAIPCMTVFTKPLTVGGLPRQLFYILIAIGCFTGLIFKNIVIPIIILIFYFYLRAIHSKDETTLIGYYKMNRKKYISY